MLRLSTITAPLRSCKFSLTHETWTCFHVFLMQFLKFVVLIQSEKSTWTFFFRNCYITNLSVKLLSSKKSESHRETQRWQPRWKTEELEASGPSGAMDLGGFRSWDLEDILVDDPSFQIDIPIFSEFIVQHVLLVGIPCLTHLLLMLLDYLLVSTWLCPEDWHCSQFSVCMVSSSTKEMHHTSLMEQQCFSTCNPLHHCTTGLWQLHCRPRHLCPLRRCRSGASRCTAVARASSLSCKDHIIIWSDIILISWIFMNHNHTIIISHNSSWRCRNVGKQVCTYPMTCCSLLQVPTELPTEAATSPIEAPQTEVRDLCKDGIGSGWWQPFNFENSLWMVCCWWIYIVMHIIFVDVFVDMLHLSINQSIFLSFFLWRRIEDVKSNGIRSPLINFTCPCYNYWCSPLQQTKQHQHKIIIYWCFWCHLNWSILSKNSNST